MLCNDNDDEPCRKTFEIDHTDHCRAYKQFIISGFRLIAAENGIVIAANYWGKFKTASQMIMIILLILHFDGIFVILEQIFIWLSLALTIISLITYIWQNRTVLSMQE